MDLTRGVSIVIPLRVDNSGEGGESSVYPFFAATADRGVCGYS